MNDKKTNYLIKLIVEQKLEIEECNKNIHLYSSRIDDKNEKKIQEEKKKLFIAEELIFFYQQGLKEIAELKEWLN